MHYSQAQGVRLSISGAVPVPTGGQTMTAIGHEGQTGVQGLVPEYIVGGTGGLTMEAGTPHDRLGPSQAKPSHLRLHGSAA